jgi:hypothetical protein
VGQGYVTTVIGVEQMYKAAKRDRFHTTRHKVSDISINNAKRFFCWKALKLEEARVILSGVHHSQDKSTSEVWRNKELSRFASPKQINWHTPHYRLSRAAVSLAEHGITSFNWWNISRIWPPLWSSGDVGSIPGTTRKKKVVGLERGPFNLVSTTEELLDRKIAAPV